MITLGPGGTVCPDEPTERLPETMEICFELEPDPEGSHA